MNCAVSKRHTNPNEADLMDEKVIQKEIDAIRQDLKQLQADTIQLKEDSKNLTSDMVKLARQKLEEETQKLLKRLQETSDDLRQHGQEAVRLIEKQVDEKPIITLLTATGIGFFLGWLSSRK
ncbi:MAG: hypothetical protein R2940_02300 [Syntrophotaleaceae bacterium]